MLQVCKPKDFASQINLNMDNCWGIIRALTDLTLKLDEGLPPICLQLTVQDASGSDISRPVAADAKTYKTFNHSQHQTCV